MIPGEDLLLRLSSCLAALPITALFGLLWSQNGPESALRGTKQFERRVVISGLRNPWEITWGPDSRLWVTERTGKRVTRVNPETGESTVAVTIDEVSAPGGQDGVLGLALHPDLLKGTGKDYVYVSYTYVDRNLGPDPDVPDPNNPYRYLYLKVVRFTWNAAEAKLTSPVNVITGLPAGNDHVGGRLKLGPDGKLYLTIGDQGHNQLGNFCLPIEAQRLPTAKEIQDKHYAAYVGKTLRINPDGSVPNDNPKLDGVVSHVYTYGHRNTQGIDFAPDGTLYGGEHGPKTDDEVNVLIKGGNYGWPNVAGLKDNKAYEYARWAESSPTPCSQLRFSDLAIHPEVPRQPESAYTKPFIEPIATLFTVPTGHNFSDPACKGADFICWPTVAISGIEHYQSTGPKSIPGWDRVLLVTTLKRGSLFVVPLAPDGKSVRGAISRYFQAENRYRDTAVSPDGRTIYLATDFGGVSESLRGGMAVRMQDNGAILAYTYTGENASPQEPQTTISQTPPSQPAPATRRAPIAGAVPLQFTAAQAAAGKTAYNASCAVCHGSTLRNGTMGTPLAGEYFKDKWAGRPVSEFYEKARKTMPPAAPASLSAEAYANIVAFILETNGARPTGSPLPSGGDALGKMPIP